VTSFIEVKIILDRLVNGDEIRMHGNFWRGKTRDELVALKVMGLPLVAVGDPAGSNLVKALRGISPFGRNLQPRPAGARFNRMPDGRTPATEAEIATIERWIAAGCPEGPLDAAAGAAGLLAAGAGDAMLDVRFWREFDDFFLFKASDETRQHVSAFLNESVTVWLSFVQDGSLAAWTAHIAQAAVRQSIAYILQHHLRLIGLLYGSPAPAARVLDSYWRFGGNLLPDDPDSSGPIRHTMNSPGDWFNWAPFLDAILRINGPDAETLLLARGWHIGLVADGLLRVDADRPPDDRLRIPDFQASDPKLHDAVVARYGGAGKDDLLAEFVRRTKETGVLGPPIV
jgi:hypothetical protein